MTPFPAIYSTPIQIYLGMVPVHEVITGLIRQGLWVLGLMAAGHLLWKNASKKLAVQGG
ncbi:hypothetical protein D3C87_2207240 [compost metagenome]